MRRWALLLAFTLTLVGASAFGRPPHDDSSRAKIDNDDLRSFSPESSGNQDSPRIEQKRDPREWAEWEQREEWTIRPRVRTKDSNSADGGLVPEPSAVVLFGTGFLIAQKALRRFRR